MRRRAIFEGIILTLLVDDPKRLELSIFYGDPAGWFKCPQSQCFAFHEGFLTKGARDSHNKKHTRDFRCSSSGCLYATVGFVHKSQLKRHIAENHTILPESEEWSFPHPPANVKVAPHKNLSNILDGRNETVRATNPPSTSKRL